MERILELCEDMETVSFAAGDVMFPEGGKTGCLYFLISGGVEVIKGETSDHDHPRAGSDPRGGVDPAGPTASGVGGGDRGHDCYVTRGGRDFLETHPKIALAVAELLAARLKGMIGYLGDLKAQYEDRKDHLGMVDELLLNLAHRTPKKKR